MGHEHDLELIAALVEGRLDNPAEAEAQAAACSECGAHRDLLVVLAAVAASPSPSLDDLERRRMRESVWEQMATPRATVPSRAGALWYYRIASVAAVLVLVVGFGVFLGARSGQDETLSGDSLEIAAASEEADDGAAGAPEQADDASRMDTSEAPSDSDSSDMTTAADEAFIAPNLDERLQVAKPEEIAGAIAHFRLLASEAVGSDVTPWAEDCVAADSLAERPPFLSAGGSVGDTPVEFVALGNPSDVTEVVVYGADDCAVLHRE
ncbi:hypothetical protein BH23ACT5_BH23ACT5_07160 [soil metagenome]